MKVLLIWYIQSLCAVKSQITRQRHIRINVSKQVQTLCLCFLCYYFLFWLVHDKWYVMIIHELSILHNNTECYLPEQSAELQDIQPVTLKQLLGWQEIIPAIKPSVQLRNNEQLYGWGDRVVLRGHALSENSLIKHKKVHINRVHVDNKV